MNYQELMAQAKAKAEEATTLLGQEKPDQEKAKGLLAEAKGLQDRATNIKAASSIIEEATKIVRPELPTDTDDPDMKPTLSTKDAAIKALYAVRFGEPDAAVKAVLTDLHGPDFEAKRLAQWRGFVKYLRYGDQALNSSEVALMREVIFTPEYAKKAIVDGWDIAALKATMVEGEDQYGGHAVPVDYQARIVERMAGYTVVRPKATIITTSRDKVEIPKMTGGDSQYSSAVRVTWVEETPSSTAADTNLTFGLEGIPVHTAMAVVTLSRNTVEDAAFNLPDFVSLKFTEALSVDEDNQFLVGTGAGKPQGILPGSANGLSLGTANSGNGSALTFDGLISLQYALDSQYRQNACWIAEKATYLAISQLKDSNGQYLWRDQFGRNTVGQERVLLGSQVLEQEAMPTIATSAFPIIFGDLSGYYIVDRIGMSIERYLDSSTATTNTVKYVMRRRLGGQCAEPWRFKLQYVSA
ncbi:MAG: phage major capsid protein [Chloroflexota bacterium]